MRRIRKFSSCLAAAGKPLTSLVAATAMAAAASEPVPDTGSDQAPGVPVEVQAVDTAQAPPVDTADEVVATIGELNFRECTVKAGQRERQVQCATFAVPEVPERAASAQIELFIVRIPARRRNAVAPDPMLFIAGGPGQAASETFLFADQTFATLARNRDFYLIDQRGTGGSNALHCGDLVSDDPMVSAYDSERIRALTRQCLESLSGDISAYTTTNTIADFEQVRRALGVERWNLLGVSYGTRVAAHYLRTQPGSVRTAVLDSVVPAAKSFVPEIAERSQNMLDVLIQRCVASTPCSEAMPDFAHDVEVLLLKLAEQPVSVTFEDFATGRFATQEFTRDHLNLLIRLYLYNTYSVALLPPMLHTAAVEGNYAPLARATGPLLERLSEQLATGLHNTVLCTEDLPYIDFDESTLAANEASYMGRGFLLQIRDICSVWPRGTPAPALREPLTVATPVLLLSGEFDPITPPAYAELAMAKLPDARHLVLPGQGHSVSGIGCAPDLVENFVRNAASDGFDAKCLERLAAAPLFINFNGTSP